MMQIRSGRQIRIKKEGVHMFYAIGIILMIVGIAGIIMGVIMYGDIGIACIVGALAALISGIGFLMIAIKSKKPKE